MRRCVQRGDSSLWQTGSMHYRHVQWGWIVVPYTVGSTAVVATMINAEGDEFDARAWAAVAAFVLALGALLVWFSRLEVTVDASHVQATFGSGSHRARSRWWRSSVQNGCAIDGGMGSVCDVPRMGGCTTSGASMRWR